MTLHNYWSFDVALQPADDAAQVVGLIEAGLPDRHVIPVDPARWWTVHADRETVELWLNLIQAAREAGVYADDQAIHALNLVDEWQEWLAQRAGSSQQNLR